MHVLALCFYVLAKELKVDLTVYPTLVQSKTFRSIIFGMITDEPQRMNYNNLTSDP